MTSLMIVCARCQTRKLQILDPFEKGGSMPDYAIGGRSIHDLTSSTIAMTAAPVQRNVFVARCDGTVEQEVTSMTDLDGAYTSQNPAASKTMPAVRNAIS